MPQKTVHLGSCFEPFVDNTLIQTREKLHLKLHEPVKREIVFTFDRAWEQPSAGYCTFLRAEDGCIRLYYRAAAASGDLSDQQTAGVAFSDDGITFERPDLGIIEHGGTKRNNLIWRGVEAHNMTPFMDENPQAEAKCRYKAIGGPMWKIYGLCSPDGIHWRKIQEDPLQHEGVFDSQNVIFWDPNTECYRSFSRYFEGGWPKGVRAIQSATSTDFINWSKPVAHVYAADVRLEHFYTNATVRYPGHPDLLLSFPNRFIYERQVLAENPHKGVSDAMFMSSRDGINWERLFPDAWVRPGPDRLNWTDRCNRIAAGMLALSPAEWTLYIEEHNRCKDQRLRRLTVRPHGFASVHAGYQQGEFVTHPLQFEGNRLRLNFATSAAGEIRVEAQEPDGHPIPGFTIAEMAPLYGDKLDHVAAWHNGNDLTALAGRPICLRFVMREADLFALQLS